MSPGKTAAQAGHAYLNTYLKALVDRPEEAAAYQADGLGTKVCLRATSEYKLMRAYEDAMAAGLPCSLIIDQHHVLPPHFDGSPIITALGIGPARRDEVRQITKRFSLLQ
ncbi:MAG: peptidyl-tRNA hydrolase [Verrucomicrobiaceae bacterium]|nr:MAG: peptidyl-tRNA hydrolase [Verrucomicrobiaceae bacterium]